MDLLLTTVVNNLTLCISDIQKRVKSKMNTNINNLSRKYKFYKENGNIDKAYDIEKELMNLNEAEIIKKLKNSKFWQVLNN